MPSGAVSKTATACARQITGSAPFRCCNGPATLSAMPYDVTAPRIKNTPVVLLRPSRTVGNAMSTAPVIPTTRPARTPLGGSWRATIVATIAAKSGTAAFNIPVIADDTCCSACGTSASGKPIHSVPTTTIPSHSLGGTDFHARGNSASVMKPITIRTNATPLGPMDRRPSAIKRKEAPQIRPGMRTSSR